MKPPSYFKAIQKLASQRWKQLESDPGLAGPWHQLFQQVQSPRHVLSELLQNAEDAGATEASAEIQEDDFVFRHNGGDFSKAHFESLCNFGHSNKRILQTIGFRGVGFKSVFSLGDEVCILTPTLSVAFQKERFTEPIWVNQPRTVLEHTEVRVKIKDEYRRRELERNLSEWIENPTSLLFFKSIRALKIGAQEIHCISQGAGPVERSEWMSLSTTTDQRYLVLRSSNEDFPDEALDEIRQERLISIGDTIFPRYHVELVLGLRGQLFAVLPTGVVTDLPYACNAPFIQDPARTGIKSPESSPTNRCLLTRVGTLAAQSMLAWLKRLDLTQEERSTAYGLFPDAKYDNHSVESSCADVVKDAFKSTVSAKRFLLTDEATLKSWGQCIAVPPVILDIWSAEQSSVFFISDARSILCRHVSSDDRQRLINWGSIKELDGISILDTLKSQHLPKPETWSQLLKLWHYVVHDLVKSSPYYYWNYRDIRIFPAQLESVMYAADQVSRLGERKSLRSAEDWEFLTQHLHILDQHWLQFIEEQKKHALAGEEEVLKQYVETASLLLERLNLDKPSDSSSLIRKVAETFSLQAGASIEDSVRLTHLAAAFGATVDREFRYYTRDLTPKTTDQQIIFDVDHIAYTFVDEVWAQSHFLHDEYRREFRSCTKSEWEKWACSNRSRLHAFVPLTAISIPLWGRQRLVQELRKRGFEAEPEYPYIRDKFVLEDWDFEACHWEHWHKLAMEDKQLWGRLGMQILQQPKEYWAGAMTARASQISNVNSRYPVTESPILPTWIAKLRDLPCVPDTWGSYRQPAELLRRTPQTESFLDVEPFVRADLDTDNTRALLQLLGVRDTPTGPDRILERLQVLARSTPLLVREIGKWYDRIDRMIDNCTTEDFQKLRNAFHNQKIILTDRDDWTQVSEVFLTADEENVPGAALIHSSVRHLMLWRKIGVAEHPTAELALTWLKSLPSGERLRTEQLHRIKLLLSRYPERIWSECAHWINLNGEWVAINELSYALSRHPSVFWDNLFPNIKYRTADLKMLSSETCQKKPFSGLRTLVNSIEYRLHTSVHNLHVPQQKKWLITLGNELRRIVLDDEVATIRLRRLAERLSETQWQVVADLQIVPYISGAPIGTPRRVEALWVGSLLSVEDKSAAGIANAVAEEIGRAFEHQEIADAIKFCYDRPTDFIIEYLEDNLSLVPQSEMGRLTTHELLSEEYPSESEKRASNDIGPAYIPDPSPVHADIDTEAITKENDSVVRQKSRWLDEGVGKPPQPSVIERFARAKGYSSDGPDRFYHVDGSVIVRSHDSIFPWEHRTAKGELLKYYLPKEHCIQRNSLELGAEIWMLCNDYPDRYALLLLDIEGTPIEVSGRHLLRMCETRELVLYPATYRLVYSEPT